MKVRGRLTALAAAGILAAAGPAFAISGSNTANIAVTATVVSDCNISTAPIGFGSYNPLAAAPNDTTGTVTITCTNGAPVTVELDNGLNAGLALNAQPRAMKNGASVNYLGYDIFQNAGRTTEWGSVAATNNESTTGTGAAQVLTAYARANAGQTTVPIGSYSDTVVAKVNF